MYNTSLVEYSSHSPHFMEPIRSELETMFYLMCWPVMLYVAGGVLTLSLCLFILGAFYAQHPNWQLMEPLC